MTVAWANPGFFYGVPFKTQGRNEFPLKDNLTASLENPFLPDPERDVGYYEENGYEATKKGRVITVYVDSLEDYKPEKFMQRCENELRLAVHKRVASVYQQLYLVYGSKMTFQRGQTQDQGEMGKKGDVQCEEEKLPRIDLNAAHNALIPNLHILVNKKLHDFLKGSHVQRGWNSTIEFTAKFNQGSEKKVEKALWDSVEDLINQSAERKTTPEKGLEEFVGLFDKAVVAELKSLKKKAQEALKEIKSAKGAKHKKAIECIETAKVHRIALKIYQDELKLIAKTIDTVPTFFIKNLFLVMDQDALEREDPKVLQFLMESRYSQIRHQASRESELMTTIEGTRKKLGFPCSKEVFVFALLNGNEPWRQQLLHLLNRDAVTTTELSDLKEPQQKKLEKIKESANFKELIQIIEDKLKTFEGQKRKEQAQTLKTVRKLRGFTRKSFFEKYESEYPRTKLTLKKYSRIERKFKPIFEDRLLNISNVLRVPAEFLAPQFSDNLYRLDLIL